MQREDVSSHTVNDVNISRKILPPVDQKHPVTGSCKNTEDSRYTSRYTEGFLWSEADQVFQTKKVKPGFTTYQTQLKDFRVLSKIEAKTIKPIN